MGVAKQSGAKAEFSAARHGQGSVKCRIAMAKYRSTSDTIIYSYHRGTGDSPHRTQGRKGSAVGVYRWGGLRASVAVYGVDI